MTTTEKKQPEYKSWQEVDIALKFLHDHKLVLKQLEVDRDAAVNKIIKKDFFQIEICKETIAGIEAGIKEFTKANMQDFKDSKTKKFTFGKVSMHTSKAIVVDCVNFAIKKLKELKMGHLVKIEEGILRSDLKKLDEKTLRQIGAEIVTEENIKVETKV